MTAALPHRRQVVLFLVAVILPSTVLVALGIRLISQEREIQRGRVADDRRAAIAEMRRLALAEFDDVEDAVLGGVEETLALASREYSQPAVRLVARVVDGRVVPPWEERSSLPAARRALAEPGFAARIRTGQRAELGRGDLQTARRTYLDALNNARSESQRGMARLLLARATAAAEGREAAEPLYLELLATPDSVVDENGVPFALYAAARLREWGVAGDDVTRRLKSAIEGRDWQSPTAFYMLRDLWPAEDGDATALDDGHIALESVLAVQRDFPLLSGARSASNGNGPGDPAWLAVGPADWLARAIGPPGEEAAAVVAVSAASIAERLTAIGLASDSALGTMEIGLPGAGTGTALGISRPDFTARFVEPPETTLGRTMGLPNAFLLMALLLVLSITLFGGYLLLNDVKRETRMAAMRSDFVSSVSHELKTPLTAIRMFAETLRVRKQPDPALTAEYLDTIVGESERLTRLLNNVLDLSNIEQGQKTYSRVPTSLADVARRAARAVEYPLSIDGFRLNLDLDEDLPPVFADGDSVEQAVLNLLTNAIKYSGTSREIDLSVHAKNGHAVIAVRDYGIGVPREAQLRLSEKFYRVNGPENSGVPGTGLGLTIVEHTARAHGGFLAVESEVGEGSTFSIHLPMEEQP